MLCGCQLSVVRLSAECSEVDGSDVMVGVVCSLLETVEYIRRI